MSSVTRLDHIAIATANLDESLRFYAEKLGIRATHTEVLQERGIQVAFLQVGDTRIELVAPLHDKSEVSAFLEKRGGGIHHLAFSTPDVDALARELEQGGVKLAQQPSPGAHGCRVAFIHPKSSGGTLLEISTPPDAGDP